MVSARKLAELNRREVAIGALVVTLGIILRWMALRRGHNYDFESYQLVASGREEGLTPWQVGRYNYGPIWAQFLYSFRWVESTFGISFRLQLVALLTAADLVIGYFFLRTRGLPVTCIFLLNPISVIITGYHNQFDNLAIAVVCLALLLNRNRTSGAILKSDIATVLLVALSLSTKHVFLVFVFWLAVRQIGLTRKLFYLCIPPLLFALSFVPFLSSSWSAIRTTVIGYDSADNGPFWEILGLQNGLGPISVMMMFVAVLSLVGFLLRHRPTADALFFYLVAIVILTPSFANQYFVIAAIGAIGLQTRWFVPYGALGTYLLATSYHGLHFNSSSRFVGVFIPDEPILTNMLTGMFRAVPLALLAGCLATYLGNWRKKFAAEPLR
jgi:hypothetical protein